MESLPSEIIDMIVDHLHRDKASLRSCSLIQKRWLLSSRYHLWSAISITLRNIKKFVSLLEDTSSNVALFVKRLAVVIPDLDHIGFERTILNSRNNKEDFDFHLPPYLSDDNVFGFRERICKVFVRLVNLKRLTIYLSRSELLPLETWQILKRVRVLELRGECDSFQECHGIIHALKSKLRLLSLHVDLGEPPSNDHLLPPKCTVKAVALRGYGFPYLIGWLLHQNPLPDVLSCQLNALVSPTDDARIGNFLRSFGHSIFYMTVWLSEHNRCAYSQDPLMGTEKPSRLIDVRSCIALQRLDFFDILPTQRCIRGIQTILSQVPPNKLEVILLKFTPETFDPSRVEMVDLREIGHILETPRFAGLRRVRIGRETEYGEVHPAVEKAIRDAMPHLHRRGILRFDR